MLAQERGSAPFGQERAHVPAGAAAGHSRHTALETQGDGRGALGWRAQGAAGTQQAAPHGPTKHRAGEDAGRPRCADRKRHHHVTPAGPRWDCIPGEQRQQVRAAPPCTRPGSRPPSLPGSAAPDPPTPQPCSPPARLCCTLTAPPHSPLHVHNALVCDWFWGSQVAKAVMKSGATWTACPAFTEPRAQPHP